MSGGYQNLPADPYEKLVRALEDQDRRLKELERPSGIQTNGVPKFDVSSGSASSVILGSSYSTVISLSIAVPEAASGPYTQALVTASAFENFGNTDSLNAVRGFMRILIDGVAGPESNTALGTSDLLRPCANTTARSIVSGLGATVTVALQAHNQVGATSGAIAAWCVANMTATAIYLK